MTEVKADTGTETPVIIRSINWTIPITHRMGHFDLDEDKGAMITVDLVCRLLLAQSTLACCLFTCLHV